eukprot:10887732-Alexandrium_andersonii.AAC.1
MRSQLARQSKVPRRSLSMRGEDAGPGEEPELEEHEPEPVVDVEEEQEVRADTVTVEPVAEPAEDHPRPLPQSE